MWLLNLFIYLKYREFRIYVDSESTKVDSDCTTDLVAQSKSAFRHQRTRCIPESIAIARDAPVGGATCPRQYISGSLTKWTPTTLTCSFTSTFLLWCSSCYSAARDGLSLNSCFITHCLIFKLLLLNIFFSDHAIVFCLLHCVQSSYLKQKRWWVLICRN